MNDEIKMLIDGKQFIGEGARRLVYKWDDRNVLKVAKSKYGIRSNKREVKTFKSAPLHVRKYIAKIRDYGKGYHWLIMKKYSDHFPNSKKYRHKLKKVSKRFKKNGIIPYEVVRSLTGKPNFENLRLKRSGRIVVIDYGNFIHRDRLVNRDKLIKNKN
jgi:hypothetical protein